MKFARLGFVVSLVLVSACGFTEARDKATGLADTYFATASSGGGPQDLLTLYDDAFYSVTPRGQWGDMLASIRKKLGRPTQHALQSWMVNELASTNGSGQVVTLVYNVGYEHASGTETIVIFIPRGSEAGHIRGHNFNSRALLQ